MSEELSIRQDKAPLAVGTKGVNITSFDELARFCLAISKSSLAPRGIQTPEAIMVAIHFGMEIGLTPMQSLQNMAVINGRPSIYGDAAMALVQSHPLCEGFEEGFNPDLTEAFCTIRRKGRVAVTRTFSVQDAKRAKLWEKEGPWSLYPKRMLQMRARSFAMRDSFPDALKGVGIVEERMDIPEKPVREARNVEIVMPDQEPIPELPLLKVVTTEPTPNTSSWPSEEQIKKAFDARKLSEELPL